MINSLCLLLGENFMFNGELSDAEPVTKNCVGK